MSRTRSESARSQLARRVPHSRAMASDEPPPIDLRNASKLSILDTELRQLALELLLNVCAVDTARAFVKAWPENDETGATGYADAMNVEGGGSLANGHGQSAGPLSETTLRQAAARRGAFEPCSPADRAQTSEATSSQVGYSRLSISATATFRPFSRLQRHRPSSIGRSSDRWPSMRRLVAAQLRPQRIPASRSRLHCSI